MKKILIIILCLWGTAQAQTTGYFRYDTTRFQKGGGNNELYIENATRAVTGGVFTNQGNGRGAWVSPAGGGSWNILGNAGTVAGTNFIGTTDAVNLQLRTGGSKRFTINTSGAFGLGTGEDYGTANYLLFTNGSGAAPSWVNPATLVTATPTLQQVFNAETGGSVLTKTDTIQFDTNDLMLRVNDWTSITGVGLLKLQNKTKPHEYTKIGAGRMEMAGGRGVGAPGISFYSPGGSSAGLRSGIGYDSAFNHTYIDLRNSSPFYIEVNSTSSAQFFAGSSGAQRINLGIGGNVIVWKSGVSTNADMFGFGQTFQSHGSSYLRDTIIVYKMPASSNTNTDSLVSITAGDGGFLSKIPQSRFLTGSGTSPQFAYWNSSTGLTGDAAILHGGTGQLILGAAGVSTGSLAIAGTTSGSVGITTQSAAGSYNFNLPTTAGTLGQFLTSAGGGSTEMTWTTPTTGTVAGSGTLNYLPKWTPNGTTLGNSADTDDGTTSTRTIRNVFSVNGALSAPAIIGTGTWIASGSSTTTKPYLLIEPSGTGSAAWNISGTGLGLNAGNGFSGNLFDAQVNGVSRYNVAYNGEVTVTSPTYARITFNRPSSSYEMDFAYQTAGANNWLVGVGAVNGTGDNFEYYTYGIPGQAMALNYTTAEATFNGNIIPAVNNSKDLGLVGTTWRDLFLGRNATIGGTLGVTTSATVPLVYGESAANGDIRIKGTSSATKTTSYVTLQEDGGFVGIGTTTPNTNLEVYNSASYTEIIRVNAVGTIGGLGINGDGSFFGVSLYNGGGSTAVLKASTNGGVIVGRSYITGNDAPTDGLIVKGNTGIGITSPTAVLHLKAGTATANTAPEKFTTGTNLTTAEAGAREFNGSFYDTKTSGLRYGLGGKIFNSSTTVPNVTTTETDLYTNTLGASTLATDNETIKAGYSVTTLGSATATTQNRIYFGGTLIYDSGALGLSLATDFRYTVEIIRESSSVVRCSVTSATTTATAAPYTVYTRITGLTLSNTQIIKITGTRAGVGAASADINGVMSSGNWEAAAGL